MSIFFMHRRRSVRDYQAEEAKRIAKQKASWERMKADANRRVSK